MTAAVARGLPSTCVDSDRPTRQRPRTTIYVISLAEAHARRMAFERAASLEPHGRSWEFYPGLTALSPALRYEEEAAQVARGRHLHARELACYSSHYETWRSFLTTDDDQALIVEDDVRLDWIFVDRVAARDLAADGIDYLKLFSKNITPHAVVSNDFHGRWLLDCRGYAYGMQAYMLTRQGARTFLDHCGGTIKRPIDDELDRSWAHGVPNLTVFPFPAFEASGPSTIGVDRDQFTPLTFRTLSARRGAQIRERLLRLKQAITGFGYARSLPAFPSRRFGRSHIQRELG